MHLDILQNLNAHLRDILQDLYIPLPIARSCFVVRSTVHPELPELGSLACEQALLFGQAKRTSRERASEGPRSFPLPLAASSLARAFLRDSFHALAQIGELARRV